MDSVFEYLQMGGHAAFIWPALGLTAAMLILMLIVSLHGLRHGEATLRKLEAGRPPGGGHEPGTHT
ncbi:MAG: heme exporter protein CcmD [Alphaproteobacteria bacterium]